MFALSFYFLYVFLKGHDLPFKGKLLIFLSFIPSFVILFLGVTVNFFNAVQCDVINSTIALVTNYSFALTYFIAIVVLIIRSLRGKKLRDNKKEVVVSSSLLLFLIAFMITGFIPDLISLIDSSDHAFAVEQYGYFGMAFFIGFLGYAVVKYKAFNVKLLATQALVVSLDVLIGAELFFAQSNANIILIIVTLFITTITGINLIKSVKKEIEAREEIEVLAKNLDERNVELKTANENQTNLIHVMNHQIKGRLGNSRNIFAELLTDDYGKVPDMARPLLEKGLEETTTGVNYVTTILKGASAESGTLPYNLTPMDFKALVTDVANKQQTFAVNKGLAYEFKVEDGAYQINGDTTQLSEAVKNLIDNSINYTPSGSISVNLGHKDGKIIFAVKDTGVGLADEDKPKLFRSGGRGKDSLSINVNSTGYGLAFVKGVVTAHSGRVWAESEGKGKGSQFYIELPEVK
jgi:signal transduction histidine kinase